ncbi:MAG: TlpA disulfide reductase family protein [bacterium]
MKKLSVTFLAILVLLSFGACEKKSPKPAETVVPVKTVALETVPNANTAPDFSLIEVNTGKRIKLSDYRGKIVILDFWATWCPPCKAEIPAFVKLQDKYRNDGLVILGVALDDETRVKNFYKQNNMNYPVVLGNREVANQYGGIQGIPTTFVIDKKGNKAREYVGYRPDTVFEEDFLSLK